MSTIKLMIVKCVTAILVSTVLASSLVAFAAANPHSTVTIIDGEKTFDVSTHYTTAEEILREADITLLDGETAQLETKNNGETVLNISRTFPVYITVGKQTKTIRVLGGTVADALAKAGITLDENSICNLKPETVITEETYIDIVDVKYVTESYEESIPFTAKVEYSDTLAKGEKKVIEGVNGTKTVTVKKTYKNGELTETETLSSVVTTPAVAQVTIVGTKSKAQKPSAPKVEIKNDAAAEGTVLYSAIKTISSLKAPKSLTLNSKGIPVNYKKKTTVQATAYTDHSGTRCASGVLPQTGYIAVNPKIIPYGTKMFIVSKDGKYVYGYAIAADTGGFVRKRPYNVDLFFNTESECRNFGRRDVVIYFL
ncbi:MAG: G5 domain-containing protein [Clostridia bacterium]|nr:G5 domain-containing protein [Clostridia bacterium]